MVANVQYGIVHMARLSVAPDLTGDLVLTAEGADRCENVHGAASANRGFEHDLTQLDFGATLEQAPQGFDGLFLIKTNLLFDWVYDLSRDPRLLDLIEDLIGPDVLLTNSIFRIKDPGSATS